MNGSNMMMGIRGSCRLVIWPPGETLKHAGRWCPASAALIVNHVFNDQFMPHFDCFLIRWPAATRPEAGVQEWPPTTALMSVEGKESDQGKFKKIGAVS